MVLIDDKQAMAANSAPPLYEDVMSSGRRTPSQVPTPQTDGTPVREMTSLVSMPSSNVPPQPSPYPPTPTAAAQQTPYVPTQNSPAVLNPEAQIGYNYQHELLARCARGDHQISKKYGVCGIVTSIICFPFGLVALLFDHQKKCDRCGLVVE